MTENKQQTAIILTDGPSNADSDDSMATLCAESMKREGKLHVRAYVVTGICARRKAASLAATLERLGSDTLVVVGKDMSEVSRSEFDQLNPLFPFGRPLPIKRSGEPQWFPDCCKAYKKWIGNDYFAPQELFMELFHLYGAKLAGCFAVLVIVMGLTSGLTVMSLIALAWYSLIALARYFVVNWRNKAPPRPRNLLNVDGIEWMKNELENVVANRVDIISLSPPYELTQLQAKHFEKIRTLTMMGGTVDAEGKQIGFNWGVNPRDVKTVLDRARAAMVKVLVVPGDIFRTGDLGFEPDIFTEWQSRGQTEISKVLLEDFRLCFKGDLIPKKLKYVCDPVALLCALGGTYVWTTCTIDIHPENIQHYGGSYLAKSIPGKELIGIAMDDLVGTTTDDLGNGLDDRSIRLVRAVHKDMMKEIHKRVTQMLFSHSRPNLGSLVELQATVERYNSLHVYFRGDNIEPEKPNWIKNLASQVLGHENANQGVFQPNLTKNILAWAKGYDNGEQRGIFLHLPRKLLGCDNDVLEAGFKMHQWFDQEVTYYTLQNCHGKDPIPAAMTAITSLAGQVYDPKERCVLFVTEKTGFFGKRKGLSGYVDPGESHLQTFQREMNEEVGIQQPLRNVRQVGGWSMGDARPGRINETLLVYCGEVDKQDVKIDTTELKEAVWVPFETVEVEYAKIEKDPNWMPKEFTQNSIIWAHRAINGQGFAIKVDIKNNKKESF